MEAGKLSKKAGQAHVHCQRPTGWPGRAEGVLSLILLTHWQQHLTFQNENDKDSENSPINVFLKYNVSYFQILSLEAGV